MQQSSKAEHAACTQARHAKRNNRTQPSIAVVALARSMLFCRRIRDSVSDVQYYLLLDVHENAEDPEHGTSLDVQVTDGQSAWVRNGLHRPVTQIADWMSTAKQALSEGSDRFTFIITPKKKPDILRIRWEYHQEMSDFQGRLAGQIDVEHVVHETTVIQNILGTALDNLSSLQASIKQVQDQCNMFRQEAETAQKHVQDYVEQKHKKEAELYVKFAAVLNEKKAKAIEWKQKAEQAQETAQKASNEGIAVEGTPPHDFADTYSQSTDPSDDDQGNIADNSHEPETSSALDSHAVSHEPPKASAQPAQQHQSLEEQPSVALDTQNDPAENSDMQEGDLMDVDTVPIPAEELDCATRKQAQANNVSNQPISEGLNTAPRPARPKAMTRRRR
ncbi:DNA repair protein xrcc4 [Trebouxia sp. C0010 RCD-2024]